MQIRWVRVASVTIKIICFTVCALLYLGSLRYLYNWGQEIPRIDYRTTFVVIQIQLIALTLAVMNWKSAWYWAYLASVPVVFVIGVIIAV